MTGISRRQLALSLVALPSVLASCGNGPNKNGGQTIDARVDLALNELYTTYPKTREVAEKSSGMLVMPLVTEGGFAWGGAYGRGALRVDGATIDYYAMARGSFGFQIGIQQYSHVLFFMTPAALRDFRFSEGWAAGGDIEYAFEKFGDTLRAETTTALSPVIAVIFGQQGLRIGATLEGTKYTRIIP